jgi:hypothetical protein
MPACLHSATACFASSLGGSIIPAKPTNVKEVSISAAFNFSGNDERFLIA